MGLEKAGRASGMECSVWQHGAGAASISVPPTDILPHISSLQSSHTHPATSPFQAAPLFIAIHILFGPVPTPLLRPPPPPKYFLLLWFSYRRLPSIPCLAQHPLLPDTQTPSLSRAYAEQRHFLLLSIQPLQPHPCPVYSLQ